MISSFWLFLLVLLSSANIILLLVMKFIIKRLPSNFYLGICHSLSCLQILIFGIYAYSHIGLERNYLFEFMYMLFTMTGHYATLKSKTSDQTIIKMVKKR